MRDLVALLALGWLLLVVAGVAVPPAPAVSAHGLPDRPPADEMAEPS